MEPNTFEIGLSSKEAARRLNERGPNTLPSSQSRTFINILWEVAREPMFILLIIATLLYLVFGDLREGLSLTTFVVLIFIITLYQEGKTENALRALRDLTSPRANVIRDGQATRISGSDVVPGDVILVNEGDRTPADGILISANDLQVDESLLTGESIPVSKTASNQATTLPLIQENNGYIVYSGTMIVQGQGIFLVRATGKDTAIGRIGVALQTLEIERSPLQKQTDQLVKIFALIGLSISMLLVILLGILQGDWIKASLAGIALAMSLLPEEFPVILTIFPALGAWRLSKHKVLTRRISAIETLGAISVLCADKTGTITENSMTATKLWVNDKYYDIDYISPRPLPEDFHTLVEFAILASETQPFDPMEKAFHRLGKHFLAQTEHLHPSWSLVHEYDLTPELPAKTHIWKASDENLYEVAIKGAPEAIMKLCHLNETAQQNIKNTIEAMAADGLRVLAVAQGKFEGEEWPSSQHGFKFTFIGIVGLSDPIREGIQEAVQQCKEASIRIIMITGDYSETAKTIAKQAGLPTQNLLKGNELSLLNDLELQERMKTVSICARINPQQKLRIVQALKANGNIVAMTGDGVNDAPALKTAHVGIAMGTRGTDVAREASSLVLLNDDFTSIVVAIKLGRRIFDNIKKSMSYILAVHVPIAGMALLPVVFGFPVFFYPIHIAFLQLIIDPACSIAFENEPSEPDIMQRSPRDPQAYLIDRRTLVFAVLQGIGVLTICLMTYHLALRKMVESEARTFTFVSLIIANLLLIYSNRMNKYSILSSLFLTNRVLVWIILATMLFLYSAIYLPFLANIFQFSSLSFVKLALGIGIGTSSILWFEILRYFKKIK